ncbi:MAG: hypothetical protein A2107_10865 [Verrucomicrobia bacterium GWF2_62_7]|nr:MAG: hypothetical protein A2107_10865 [Verrucomicrobia bacterium GWF2_62_7]
MFGDPAKRNGFWEFYDHWDEYAKEFALGPRPEDDPSDWPQRTPEGKPYFQMGPDKRHYKPFRRWTVCVNHPGWRAWCKAFTRWIARAGYDGLWIDNACIQRCYCRHCQALAKQLGLPPLAPSQPGDLVVSRNRGRVWIESHLRLWDELRVEGEAIRPGFGIYVNYIEIPFNREVTDHTEVAMIEHVWLGITRLLWPGGIWAGFYPPMPDRKVLYNHTQPTTEARAFENTWAFQLTCAMRGRRGVHWLYGPPAGSRDLRFEHNEATALLALAEAAAFGGGSATHVATQRAFTDTDANGAANAARQRFFREFLPQHLDLYRGLQPAGNVAIVVFFRQAAEMLLEAQQVHEALRWQGVLCDVVNGDTTDAATLQHYRWLVLPGEPALPDGIKSLSFIRSPAPLTAAESRAVTNAYQAKKPVRPLRDTGLAARALELIGKDGPLFAPGTGSRVAAAAWSAPDKIALHLLNYRAPIGRGNADKVEAVASLRIALPLTAAGKVTAVRAWSPERAGPLMLEFQQLPGKVVFTLPSLRVYEVCEVLFQP